MPKEARRPLGRFRKLAQRAFDGCHTNSHRKGDDRAYRATDGIAQSRTGISPTEMMFNVKDLPVQEISDYF